MKRKIIAIVMAAFMTFAAVGCTTQEAGLYNEMKKVSAWENTETKGKVAVAAEADGQKVSMGLDFTGYSDTKALQAYVQADVTDITIGDFKVAKKMSPVKVYVDHQTVYISKSYFTDLLSITGEPLPAGLSNIKEEFIGLDTSQDAKTAKIDNAAAMKLYEKLFSGSDMKIPVTQNGRNYTVTLNSSEMVDLIIQFSKQILNNMDEINKFSDTQLTQKDVDAQKPQIEAMIAKYKPSIQAAVNGSSFKADYSFTDNSYTEKMAANIKLTLEGETLDAKISAEASSTQTAKKDFKLPASVKVLTLEQFMQTLGVE